MCIVYFYFVLWVSHACDCALCPHQWCMIPSHTYLSMAMEFIHKFRFNHYIVIPGNERKFAHAHHAVRFMRCICIENMDRIIRSNQCNVSATQKSMHCIFIVAVVAIGRLSDVFFIAIRFYACIFISACRIRYASIIKYSMLAIECQFTDILNVATNGHQIFVFRDILVISQWCCSTSCFMLLCEWITYIVC